MISTRYEEYSALPSELPFVLRIGLERTATHQSSQANWHADPELQYCTAGEGTVRINGERYRFREGDFVAVNPDEIHYTGTDSRLVYTCLIVKADFCRQVGIDCAALGMSPHFRSDGMAALFGELETVYCNGDDPLRTVRLNGLILRILLELAERHAEPRRTSVPGKGFGTVKGAVKYIRENFARRLSLDEIARAVCTDKYALCRQFKAFTGQTVVEHINSYRCARAAEVLSEGATVSEAAVGCGFENLSFFTKTFKKHMNALPSQWKSR